MFFLKMRHFEKKNPPTAENDFKWPTFKATVKCRNYLQERGREAPYNSSL